jgi:hypothetical protein
MAQRNVRPLRRAALLAENYHIAAAGATQRMDDPVNTDVPLQK